MSPKLGNSLNSPLAMQTSYYVAFPYNSILFNHKNEWDIDMLWHVLILNHFTKSTKDHILYGFRHLKPRIGQSIGIESRLTTA